MGRCALIVILICGIMGVALPALSQQAAKTAPAVPVTPPAEVEGEEETDIVAGKITAVEVANNTLTVTDEAGKSYVLTATEEETSIWKGDNTIKLADVKVDDPVELEYYKDKDGKLVAIWIDVLAKEAAMPAESGAPGITTAPVQ